MREASVRAATASRGSGNYRLGAGADVRCELVPAAHRLELGGRGGGRAVELVDGGVDAPRALLGLAVRGLRDVPGRHVAAPAAHPGAAQGVRPVSYTHLRAHET